jgi:hypothetical protein
MVCWIAIGCSYTSSYVPPDDARMRPVWIERSIVAVGPAAMPSCAGEPGTTLTFREPAPDPDLALVVQLADLIPDPEAHEEEDGDAALVAVLGIVVAAAGITVTALALGLAPAGTSTENAITIDAVNEFNDELRRPTRCGLYGTSE